MFKKKTKTEKIAAEKAAIEKAKEEELLEAEKAWDVIINMSSEEWDNLPEEEQDKLLDAAPLFSLGSYTNPYVIPILVIIAFLLCVCIKLPSLLKDNNSEQTQIASVVYEDHTINLPIKFSKFSKITGFTLPQDFNAAALSENEMLSTQVKNSNNTAINITLFKPSDKVKNADELKVMEIDVDDAVASFSFPNDIKIGDNISSALEKLGNNVTKTDLSHSEGYFESITTDEEPVTLVSEGINEGSPTASIDTNIASSIYSWIDDENQTTLSLYTENDIIVRIQYSSLG